jgi:PPOX class probable F420-dependent enzyme
MQLEASELDHVLSVWPVARLATVAASGRPALVPIVFAMVDGAVCSPIDAKPKRTAELQRLRNVARDARAALLLDHYADDWRDLWWLRVDVHAEVCDEAALGARGLERIEAALAAKYPQYRDVAVFRGAPHLLRMAVESHVAWSASEVDWLAIRHGGAV